MAAPTLTAPAADLEVLHTPRRLPHRAGAWFRPDVEGLRAVAVLAVLAFHAGIPHATGGFVGVDVFFVISGFLITTLLVRELERTGSISLSAFYARRCRRILPPAALVLAVTVVLARFVLPPLTVGDVASDGLAVAVQAGNWHFIAAQVDYSAAGRADSPLLHYWSLAVEEQFYLLWAPLVLGCGLLTRQHRRRALLMTIGTLCALSFGLSLHWTAVAGPLAYMGSPSRAWQFGIGAMLALAAPVLSHPVAHRRAGRQLTSLLGWVGLAAIGWATVVFDASTPYPGFAAIVPTLGAAAVIVAGTATALRPATGGRDRVGVGALLATPPMRVIGRISFGWYLWHWPALILGQAVLGPLSWPYRALIVLACGPVAAATHHLIERPLQRAPSVSARPRDGIALGVAATVGSLVVAIAVGSLALTGMESAAPGVLEPRLGAMASAGGWSGVFSEGGDSGPVLPAPAAARADTHQFPAECELPKSAVTSPPCRFSPPGSHWTAAALAAAAPVVLYGDSHAAQWYPLAQLIARQLNAPVEVLTKSGCPVSEINAFNSEEGQTYVECYQWRQTALARIRLERPRIVILGAVNRYLPEGTPLSAWLPTVHALLATGAPVVYLLDNPFPQKDIPACMSGHLADWSACAFPRTTAARPDPLANAAVAGELPGVHVVSPWALLCPKPTCPAARGGILLYRDESHLTNTAATLLAPFLLDQLVRDHVLPPGTPARPGRTQLPAGT